MKTSYVILTTALALLPTTIHAAETAHARLYCESLRFQQGTTYGGTLDLSSTGGSPYNGELLPYSINSREWASYFFLYYGGYGTIPGTIYVYLPSFTDANSNGFDDFFEVSQGVNGTSPTGSEYTSLSSGTVTATWNRAARSQNGTCQLHVVDYTYGDLGTYSCPFTLLEYTGPLKYTPGSNTVSASINLTQTGNSANTLQGPIVFDKSTGDRFNTLTNRPGFWTNAALQTLNFDEEIVSRDSTWPTNYAGYAYFSDGEPNTAAADYQLWVLSIDDTNDANANGIPDFSDDPQSTLPRSPLLTLARGSTNLLLTIHGDIGHIHQVQQVTSLSSANWQTVLSTNLTSDPQVLSLPLPLGSPTFWRVLAQ